LSCSHDGNLVWARGWCPLAGLKSVVVRTVPAVCWWVGVFPSLFKDSCILASVSARLVTLSRFQEVVVGNGDGGSLVAGLRFGWLGFLLLRSVCCGRGGGSWSLALGGLCRELVAAHCSVDKFFGLVWYFDIFFEALIITFMIYKMSTK
ncbi:hypothetical protein V8G54_000658, partial [Vigna mungo]